ncbi:hypothetical protein [Spirosoma jeollabukense]
MSVDCDTNQLVAFLKSLSQLKQIAATTFTNDDRSPLYINISLLWTNHIYSWSDKDRATQRTNLIAIVCAKDELKGFQELKDTFVRIATFLSWQLVDEENEEEIEDFILWKPNEKTLS